MTIRFPSDLGMRLLALVIAVALWFVAASDTQTPAVKLEERVVSAVISLEGVSPDLVPVTKAGSVEVRLRAPGGVGVPEQLQAYADLTGRKAGEHRVPITVNVPPRFTIVSVTPDQLAIRLEHEITRTLPVEIAVISMPIGATVAANIPDPANVTISGAESRVKRVVRALAAVTYTPGSLSVLVNVRPVDSAGVDVPEVTVKPRQVRVLLDVPNPDVVAEEPETGQGANLPALPPQTAHVQPPQPAQPTPRPTMASKQSAQKQPVTAQTMGANTQ